MADSRSQYLAHPVKGLSSAFAILFAISGILHIYQNSKYKCWRLLWLLPCTSIIFVAGFICLEYNAFHPTAFAPSQGLLYSAAAILLACLGIYLFHLIATQPDTFKPWSSILYGINIMIYTAIISLTAQGTSNFFNPNASTSSFQSDIAVLQAGVVLLLVANIAFLGILALFQRHSSKSGTFRENASKRVGILTLSLYASGILLLARNLFRTVQIFSSAGASAWHTEAFFWVFDAAPLLICMLLLNVLHPGEMAPGGQGLCR